MTTSAATKVQILRLLGNEEDPHSVPWVAQTLRLSEDQVRDVVRVHGYPDKSKMRWAADVLERDLSQVIVGSGGVPATEVNEVYPRPLSGTLAAAKQTGVKKIIDKAERVEALLAELEQETKDHNAKAEARAEVARLEAQLAEARKVLGPAKKRDPHPGKVRAWAQAQGIEVPPRGRVSKDLLAKYAAAHPEEN